MSEYFSFYLGRKRKCEDEKEKFFLIGPYFKDPDGELKPRAIYSRSRSFIDNDINGHFTKIPVDLMDEDFADMASFKSSMNSDERVSIAWSMPVVEIFRLGSHKPVTGFVPLDFYDEVMGLNADDSLYLPKPVTTEYYCGLPKSVQDTYGFVSYVSRFSQEYVFNCIAEALSDAIEYDKLGDMDDLYLILVRS